ncbi:dihydrolipoamide acetyltransferase family protein [candidate division KSB1 bacterium]
MAKFEVIMPKMGESIIEATITKWLKSEGDSIEEEDVIIEIATDKVDSEIPSPVDGRLVKRFFKEGDTVEVGKVIAIIATEGEEVDIPVITEENPVVDSKDVSEKTIEGEGFVMHHEEESVETYSDSNRFYSPLVKSIAKEENISVKELDNIKGSGRDGRVTKKDILIYIEQKKSGSIPSTGKELAIDSERLPVVAGSSDEIMEMDRLRKLIADHMVMSVRTSAHVTSFIEVDMTNIVKWREKIKDDFLKKENEKITFTHIFVEAIAKTVRDYPMVNVSVDGYKIIKRKNINIGMAVALPSGNLIVPVVKKADQLNLRGIVKRVNDLADRARSNKLTPDEIQDGTITLTNLGSFGTVMGTPIINQPQVAIVAVGSIKKRPVVLETADGDVIGIRQMMYLSLTYDHRVIDGALGGTFINKMKQYLENFDVSQGV